LPRLPFRLAQIVVDRHPRLFRQFKPHGPSGLLLPDGRAIHRVSTRCYIINPHSDDITAAKLAVDG
jgi:hypothetical protein